MLRSSDNTTDFFRKYSYFDDAFPFDIWREVDSSSEFNERKRFRREFWKIVLIVSGQGEQIINNERFDLHPGSIFLIHPDDETTYNIRSGCLELYNIIFLPSFPGEEWKKWNGRFDFFTILSRPPERGDRQFYAAEATADIRRIVRTMEREYDRAPANFEVRLRLLLLELLLLLSRQAGIKVAHRSRESIAEEIAAKLDRDYSRKLTLSELAKKWKLDESRLCRLFRARYGKSVMTALREKRLAVAAGELRSTDSPVMQIALRCGFSDLSYFYRAFRLRYGKNPGAYRGDKTAAESGEA